MTTLADVETTFGITHYDYLDRQVEIPTVTTAACQGDVSFLRVTTKPATTAIPKAGVVVMQSEQGGHTHTLHGAGMFERAMPNNNLLIGHLTVPDGADVIVSHPEHGSLLFAPGTYRVGSQREYAGEWRAVAD